MGPWPIFQCPTIPPHRDVARFPHYARAVTTELASPGVPLVVLCAVLVLIAAAIYKAAGVGPLATAPAAVARGAVQLAVVSLVIAAALAHLWSSLLVLAGMFAAAAFTSARRARAGWSGAWLTAGIAAGMFAVLPLMLLSGVVPLNGVALVAIGGIIMGNAMVATSLAARLGLDAVRDRWGEVEAGLSLGLTVRDARIDVVRSAASAALLPGVDQTRTVGLVTLPGAFIGVLLASGSAAAAGAVQILVLAGVLLAQTCAVAVAVELVARGVVDRPR